MSSVAYNRFKKGGFLPNTKNWVGLAAVNDRAIQYYVQLHE